MSVKETRRTPLNLQRKAAKITVGIHTADGEAEHKDSEGLTVAEIGAFHEFGTRRTPQRSFIRSWFDESVVENRELILSQLKLVAENKLTLENALERIALKCESSVKKRIARRIPPPLSPVTIARKGSSVPLIDTGQLRASIRGKAEIIE